MTCVLITSDWGCAVAASLTGAFGIEASSVVVILSATSVSCTWSFAESPCETMYAPAMMNANPSATAPSQRNRRTVASAAISFLLFYPEPFDTSGRLICFQLSSVVNSVTCAFGPLSHDLWHVPGGTFRPTAGRVRTGMRRPAGGMYPLVRAI